MGELRTYGTSPQTQEVRIATTMTGGVSLAVWMAGVARELDLLRQASEARRKADHGGLVPNEEMSAGPMDERRRYQKLLDLLDVVVDPDIFSGTSAGGINAIMLAYARATGGDLGSVREMWLDLGDMGQLLREPSEKDVPSLMYGDRHLYAKLRENLKKIPPGQDPGGSDEPERATAPESEGVPKRAVRPKRTTLYVTTTMLTGESSRFSDALGTQVQDTEHRAVFTFRESALREDGIVGPLALAGRSTASFPGAFEPAFVPYGEKVPGGKGVDELPPMNKYVSFTRDHWVADGGLLANQPIDVLLRRVFDSTAEGPVRRVLMFVVPSTGPAPDVATTAPRDDRREPYGLLDGLLKDVDAMVNQSIGSDLRSVMTHNQRITARGRLRLHLAELGDALQVQGRRLLSEPLYQDYARTVSHAQASALVSELLELLSTVPREELPGDWRPLLSIGGTAELEARQDIAEVIQKAWPDVSRVLPANPLSRPKPSVLGRTGQAAYDDGKSVVLSLLRLASDVVDSAAGPRATADVTLKKLNDLVARLHANQTSPAVGPLDELADLKRAERDDSLAPAPHDVVRDALQSDQTDGQRKRAAGTTAIDERWLKPDMEFAQVTKAIGERWVQETVGQPDRSARPEPKVRGAAWTGLGTILRAIAKVLPDEIRSDDKLAPYLRYGGLGAGTDPEQVSSDAVAMKLFDLVVAERAMLPEGAGPFQAVELVQVSADTRSALANRNQSRAEGKLTGMQFHHFGAFYKRTWRANDWMWGRLDGAGWLVYMLLDPRRLRSRVARHHVGHGSADWLIEQILAEFRTELGPERPSDAVYEELKFLDEDATDTPRGLPKTALWLAQAWQRPIADDELLDLAEMVIGTPAAGKPDVSPADTRTWARKVIAVAARAPELVHQELRTCPVSRETFTSDRGTPLMVKTLTKAAATGTGAVRSMSQLPGPVVPAVTTVRSVALGGYRLAGGLRGSPAWMILGGLILLAAGIMLAMAATDVFSLSGVVVAALGGYLLTFGAWQRAGWKMVGGALLSVTAVAAVFFLVTPFGRSYLFARENPDGVAGAALDWLEAEPLRPLIIVGVVIAAYLLGAASAVPRRVRLAQKGKAKVADEAAMAAEAAALSAQEAAKFAHVAEANAAARRAAAQAKVAGAAAGRAAVTASKARTRSRS